MLHFAYGANMHRAVMREHAPGAAPLGVARLADYRFVVTADGYASIVPAPAHAVHGVLWRLTSRDRVTLDLWENIASGLYRAVMLPAQFAGLQRRVLVYIARQRRPGGPKPGYMEIVVAAAGEFGLPEGYIAGLQHWLPRRARGRPSQALLLRRIGDALMTVSRIVVVRGRVQGVGYRAWTETTALERGLQGWVRNRRDGSVEALFEGLAEVVAAMIEECRRGPLAARVDSVDHREAGPEVAKLRRRGELFSVLMTA